jgi:hypothetical protein
MANVADLVRDDSIEFITIEALEQAAADPHARISPHASEREGVRCSVVDNAEPD